MFNVAVIRLKDLVKYFFSAVIVICIGIILKQHFTKQNLSNINIGQKFTSKIDSFVKEAINIELPYIEQVQNKKENTLIDENKILNTMLKLELGIINAKEKTINKTIQKEENTAQTEDKNNSTETINEDEKGNIELAKTDLKTEVITKNPIKETYTDKYKGVKIKNETSFSLTDDEMNPDSIKIDKSNIIIFHTHTCESYTSSEKYSYTPTGNYRTTDLNYSVARVGDELTKYLEEYGIKTIHNKAYHDYPSYNGSYSRSLSTVSKMLKNTKADIIIDLHRDAIGSNSKYAPIVKIGEDVCAQIMFVMGSNGGGLTHPSWKENLKFAIKVQQIANNTYPGLFKPIILRNSRYNQHLSKAACIIEVGATGNTLEQCLNSMKYLSEIINEL